MKYPSDPWPSNIFTTENHQELCDWLCKFTAEAHKADHDGTEYTRMYFGRKDLLVLIILKDY